MYMHSYKKIPVPWKENPGVKFENPKIWRKKIPQKLGGGERAPLLKLRLAQGPPTAQCQNWPPEPFGGGDMGGRILNFVPDLPKIGETPTPKFHIVGKP